MASRLRWPIYRNGRAITSWECWKQCRNQRKAKRVIRACPDRMAKMVAMVLTERVLAWTIFILTLLILLLRLLVVCLYSVIALVGLSIVLAACSLHFLMAAIRIWARWSVATARTAI